MQHRQTLFPSVTKAPSSTPQTKTVKNSCNYSPSFQLEYKDLDDEFLSMIAVCIQDLPPDRVRDLIIPISKIIGATASAIAKVNL